MKERELVNKLKTAVAACNEAEASVSTAQAELVSRSKAVGVLLLEAKKLHPAVKDFEKFLKQVDGLKLSRAYDCMRIAGGRKTDEDIRKDTRDRVKRHREKKKKIPRPVPAPLPKPPKAEQKVYDNPQEAHAVDSVTGADVTESKKPEERKVPQWMTTAEASSRALAEFTFACQTYLPRITVDADREAARRLVDDLLAPKEEAA
jgi:hypothetical protein